MYCHLCQIEVSPTHDSSSGHTTARQLVAVAIDRLSNYTAASEDSAGTIKTQDDVDKTVKTPDGITVCFCDSCNVVVPVTEHVSHLRRRDHALALLKEQTFEELVQAYLGEDPKLEPTESTDDGAFFDEAEAVNTYTCNICDIEVPQVFKPEHERGSRHRASRGLTLAASRRARDMISTSRSDGHKGHKFTGKMMKKLFKAYTGESGGCDDDKTENAGADVETTNEAKRLTAKEYFTDVMPFLPYIGSFYTLIIDNTEFVTIQIGSETVKIHVNNLNGLHNFEMNGGYYTTCRLCDGFPNSYYSSIGQQDKCHVMSLGHIKNVLSPIESVHLIRKIDNSHSICALCNVAFASHFVENHILKDTRHSMALSEALAKGKEYKESNEHLKIMVYMPPTQKQSIFMKPHQFNNNQNKWTFGIPQQPRCSGPLFGNAGLTSTQNTGFANAQISGFGSTRNASIPSTQAGFGTAQNSSFDGANGNIFGVAQPQGQTSVFNNATQANSSAFGTAQNQVQTNAINHGSTQNTTTFGTAQNSIGFFGNSQIATTGFGAQNIKTLFRNAQNNTTFGSAQPAQANVQQNPAESQNYSSVFGPAQNTTRPSSNPQNNTTFALAQPAQSNAQQNPAELQSNSTVFSSAQNTTRPSSNPQNNTTFAFAQPAQSNAQQNPPESQNYSSVFGPAQNTTRPSSNPQSNTTFAFAQPAQANVQQNPAESQKYSSVFGPAQNTTRPSSNPQNNMTFAFAQPTRSNAQQTPAESQSNSNVVSSAQNTTRPSGNAQIKDVGMARFGAKTAVNATDQSKNLAFFQVKNQQPPAGLHSQQNSAFDNAQSPSQNKEGKNSEQKENNVGDAQAQSKKVKKIYPASTPKSYNYSSSSDSDEDYL